jgi:hypothetical protein
MYAGTKDSKSVKIMPDHVKTNRLCVDSAVVSIDKVKILVENTDFGKIYWTDESGNIELKFNEIVPEPTEADSVFNIIIQYGDLFGAVKVRSL